MSSYVSEIIIKIYTTPVQEYTLKDRVISIGNIRKPLGGVIGTAENANMTVTLDNSDNGITRFFCPPPLGVAIEVGSIFSGVITNVNIGQTVQLSIESGSRIPLSDNIPLLDTSNLSAYRKETVIPVIYGDVIIEALKMDADGYSFLIASHPIEAVEEVYVDNVLITGWQFQNKQIETINNGILTMAILTVEIAAKSNEVLTLKVRGKKHPKHIGIIENPADIIWDILRNICNVSVDYYELDAFRFEMANKGIKLSGVLNDKKVTIRSVIDEIATATGAIWSGDISGIVIPFLDRKITTPNFYLMPDKISEISIKSALTSIYTRLKVSFSFDFAQKQPQKTALFASIIAEQNYGIKQQDIENKWLSGSRDIENFGNKYLQFLATPQWEVTFTAGGDYQNISPGDIVTIEHPYLPNAKITEMITGTTWDVMTGDITCTMLIAADALATAKLIDISTAFAPETLPGPNVQFTNGKATITFTDEEGNPLVSAKVTLDGTQIQTTNAQGKATFTATRGIHSIKVEANGYNTMEGEIEI